MGGMSNGFSEPDEYQPLLEEVIRELNKKIYQQNDFILRQRDDNQEQGQPIYKE